MEAALARFQAADTQVLGVSIDSVYSHANWASSLGGVSFPLLADFHPKGAVAQGLGHYLDAAGIGDRATVIIDKTGVVQYSVSVTPGGKREVDELVAECERVNAAQGGGAGTSSAAGVPAGTRLFVKSACGPSRQSLLALDNLGLRQQVQVDNVSENAAAKAELESLGGKDQAPCLILGGEATYEAADIVSSLAERVAPLAGE